MIGKILLDRFGVTEKLGGIRNTTVKITTEVNNKELKILKKDIQDCNTTAEVDVVINQHGLSDIEGLPEHVKELYEKGGINTLKANDVNNFINNQNHKNIADQAHGFKGVNTAIKEYNKLTGEASKSKFRDAIKNTNHSLADYLSNLGQADAGIMGYGKSLAIATAKTFALQAATTVLNAAVSMGISGAINIAVTAITHWIAKENELLETASALGDELNSTISDIDSYKDKINELKGTISDSGSSIEEVTSARQELMTIQDELIEKYGKEAGGINLITEAINGETSALNELKRAKYEESKAEVNEKEPGDYVNDFATTFENGHKELFNVLVGNPIDDGIEEEKSKFDELVENMESRDITIPLTMDESIDNLIESAGFSKTDFGFSIHGSAYDVRDKLQELKELTGKYDLSGTDFSDNLQEEINSVNALISANDTLYKQYVLYEKVLDTSSGKNYEEHYNSLTNAAKEYNDAKIHGNEEEIQSASEKYANALHEAMKTARENEDYDVEEYFKNLYPTIQKEVSKWDFSSDMEINTDGIKDNVENAISKLKDWSSDDILNFNAKTATETEIEGYGLLEKCAEKYNMDIKELVDLLQKLGYIKPEQYNKLVKRFGEDNLKKLSKDEIEIAYGFKNISDMTFEELQNKIAETRKKAQETKTFSQVWNSIGTTGSDEEKKAAKEAKEEILELAKAGKLTQEKLKKSPIADEFDKASISIEEATKRINKFAEASDQLATMGKGMSSITGALDEKQTNLSDKKTRTKGVKAETLAGFDAEIKGLESWDEFERTLGNGKKSMEQCRRAANKLATEWMGSNNFLANLNDTSKDYYISSLNNMGVENAEAIVTEMVALKRQEEAQATADAEAQAGALAITKNGVTAETLGEVDALLQEKGASDELKYSMADAIAKENIFSNNSLSVDQKIEALRRLINQYYSAGEAADFLKKVQNGEDYQTAFNNSTKSKLKSGIDGTIAQTPIVKVRKPSKNSDKKKGTKKQKQKKQKESKQEFDWMERKVTVLNNKLSETQKLYEAIATSMKKADSSAMVRKENANLNKQISTLRKLRSAYGKQEKKYQSKANRYAKKNLSKDLQKKVKNGQIKGAYSQLVKKYGQKKADKIQTAIDLYDKASTARQSKTDANTQIKDAKIQKHQNRADLAQTRIDKNAAKAELKHLSKKNKYIDNEIKYTKNLYSHQIAIARLNRDSEEVARLQAEKQKEIRDFKIEKLQNLADEKEESYNLYKTQASMATNYKEKNKLGKNGIEQLKKQYDYLIKIAKEEGNVTEQKRLQLEKFQEINEASKESIQNVAEDYENRLIGNARQMQAWNNAASLAEAKGKTVNADFYHQMASVTGQEEKKRKKEVDDAWDTYYKQMKDNPNFIHSPQWYEAIQTINDATDAYEQAQISAEQYRQKAIQANWEIADSARQAIEYLNEEAETYKNIFGYKDMYDKDGILTNAGTATFALDVYGIENNADTIRKVNGEIDDLNKLYKYGKISVEEYDKRMQELRENALNAAESIYSLRDAMKSLIEEGLNAEMDALNEAIDNVKKNLSDASSLREYQKNIEKQTKNIASLERQISARSGDMSEKGRADVQKLKVQLEEAKSELEDTEYDKYIEDQERILDDMSDDFQKYLDAQLDQVDRLLKEIIDSVKNGNVDISEIIRQVGDTIGVDLSKVLTESLSMFATTGNTNAGGVYDNTVKDYDNSAKEEFDKGSNAPIMNTDEKKGMVQTNGQASNTTSNNTSTWQQGTPSEELKKHLQTQTTTSVNSSNTDALKPISEEKERKSSNSKNMGNIMKVLARVRKKDKDKDGSKETLSNYGSQKFANKYGKGNNKYLSMENVKKADNYVKKLVNVKTGKPMYDTSTGGKTYKALVTLNGKYGGVFGDAVKNRKAKLPVGGFSKGGVVDTSTLKKIAKDNGDDAWVTVKSGEGILNPLDMKNLEALTDSLKNIRHPSAGILDSKNIVPNNVNANRNMYGDINVHLDGSNVIDPKSFVKTVQSSREARNVILDVFASATTNDTMAYMRR